MCSDTIRTIKYENWVYIVQFNRQIWTNGSEFGYGLENIKLRKIFEIPSIILTKWIFLNYSSTFFKEVLGVFKKQWEKLQLFNKKRLFRVGNKMDLCSWQRPELQTNSVTSIQKFLPSPSVHSKSADYLQALLINCNLLNTWLWIFVYIYTHT